MEKQSERDTTANSSVGWWSKLVRLIRTSQDDEESGGGKDGGSSVSVALGWSPPHPLSKPSPSVST